MKRAFYYLTHWEVWHWFAKYIIIGPAWVWLCIKARSIWFFTPSNPGIQFGGFLGERKRDIYEQLPEGSYPKSNYISPGQSFTEVEQSVTLGGFMYPIVVKPDIGMMGFMFRKIETRQQLRQYHSSMKVDYIIQEYIDYPLEVSVFYYRIPGEAKGTISGFVRKDCMQVTGDGVRTLKQLILDYPRAQFRLEELFNKHQGLLTTVLANGENFTLSDALNLSRGGQLVNLEKEKDEQLLEVFDRLSHHTNFYYGRYDIKCQSIEDLKQGKNFSILEFNGCGGEAHHVYSGFSFIKACLILIQHWNILYKISKKNEKSGIKAWNHSDGSIFLRKAQEHFAELKKLDNSFSFAIEKKASVSRTILPPVVSPVLQKHVA